MGPEKKKSKQSNDVDPKVLRKIKEPRTDLIDDIEEETVEPDLVDEEKAPEGEDDSF